MEVAPDLALAAAIDGMPSPRPSAEVSSECLFDDSPFGMYIVDRWGRITDCNDVFVGMSGALRDGVIGFNLLESSKDLALVPYLRAALDGEPADFETRYTSVTDGRVSEYRHVFHPLPGGNPRLAVLCFVEDVYERREIERTQRALKLSEEMFSKAFRSSPDPMIISEIATGLIREVNAGFTECFGYSAAESVGRTTAELGLWANIEQRDRTVALMREHGQLRDHEVEFLSKSGDLLTVLGSATQLIIDGSPYWLVQFRDITERKRLQVELERQAHTDFLTGLANRRHYIALAEIEVARAQRYGGPLSLLMLDVDLFKTINDTWGHLVGDEVLRRIALTCKGALREVDFIGRVGGEEFSIMLPETPVDVAREVAERIRALVASIRVPVDADSSVRMTISIGVAALKAGETEVDHLLARADQALYAAKRGGRDQVRVLD